MLKLTSEMLISVDLCHSCYMSAVFPRRKAAEGFISLLGVLLFELRQATALRRYPKRGCKWLFRGNVHKGVWSTQLRGLCGHPTGTRRGLAPVHLAVLQEGLQSTPGQLSSCSWYSWQVVSSILLKPLLATEFCTWRIQKLLPAFR